jgi:hypothetical protein
VQDTEEHMKKLEKQIAKDAKVKPEADDEPGTGE